jgi:3',5'-cyclic AMP phosphodiesterase CpdA
MRLAVVSDIHGNLTALEAVAADVERRGVDHVVHGGDVALIGARPAEVVDRVAELGWPGILSGLSGYRPLGVSGGIGKPELARARNIAGDGGVGGPSPSGGWPSRRRVRASRS